MRAITISEETRLDIEKHRELWAVLAKQFGWYTDPFYVQVWLYKNGLVSNSVSFRGMTADIIIPSEEN